MLHSMILGSGPVSIAEKEVRTKAYRANARNTQSNAVVVTLAGKPLGDRSAPYHRR